MDEPIITNITAGAGLTTPEPFVRSVRVLLSPLLQPGIADVAMGYTEVPPGHHGSRHNHPSAAEIWMFISGTGRASVGDIEVETGPGTVVYTPPGVHHQFFNSGPDPVKIYYVYSPSGPERDIIDGEFR